jgi:hypothetical protein
MFTSGLLHMKHSSQHRRWAIGLVGLGILLKVVLLLMEAFPFHADEAIVGLMARHILQGQWPAFFYGQAYMGSADSTLVAGSMMVLGETVIAIRAVQVLLYAGTIATTMTVARQAFQDHRVAILAGALIAVPTVNVTLYTTVSLGGYGEALLIGNLLLLTALRFHRDSRRTWPLMLWAGLSGLGLWVFGITLVFIVPTAVVVVRALVRSRAGVGVYLGGVVAAAVGAAPWWLSALDQGMQVFVSELFGSAIAGASPAGFIAALASHTLGFLLFGPTVIAGLRPPWEIRWLAGPLLPVAIAFWLGALIYAIRKLREKHTGRRLIYLVGLLLLLGFLITPFGADPSGRYFVPLAVPLAVMAAEFALYVVDHRSSALGYGVVGTILVFNLWGTFESALRNPPGITTQFNPETRIDAEIIPLLAEILDERGEHRGYTTYWVAYPLAFHSREAAIYVPHLPYHRDFRYTSRDDRYPPYKGMVESSERVAYITVQQPELDQRIREAFESAGISWQEQEVGEFRIFLDLESIVHPGQLDLEPDRP